MIVRMARSNMYMVKAKTHANLGHAQTGELTQLLQVIVTCAAMMENKCGPGAQLLVRVWARSMLSGNGARRISPVVTCARVFVLVKYPGG